MFSLSGSEWWHLIYLVMLIVMLLSSFYFRNNINKSKMTFQILSWFLIILIIALLYNFRDSFIPHKPKSYENRVEISKSIDDHFYITLKLNGKDVLFLIDTGASDTTLSVNDAKKIGIDTDNLVYNKPYNTANGTIFGAMVSIDSISINDKTFNNVWVSVNKEKMDRSLLGMNFLSRLQGYTIAGDKMYLYF